jgi:hypothetical protein
MSGNSPFLRGTSDMLARASDVTNSDPRTKQVLILQMTWSKGDHLVVKPGIKTLAESKDNSFMLQSSSQAYTQKPTAGFAGGCDFNSRPDMIGSLDLALGEQ